MAVEKKKAAKKQQASHRIDVTGFRAFLVTFGLKIEDYFMEFAYKPDMKLRDSAAYKDFLKWNRSEEKQSSENRLQMELELDERIERVEHPSGRLAIIDYPPIEKSEDDAKEEEPFPDTDTDEIVENSLSIRLADVTNYERSEIEKINGKENDVPFIKVTDVKKDAKKRVKNIIMD